MRSPGRWRRGRKRAAGRHREGEGRTIFLSKGPHSVFSAAGRMHDDLRKSAKDNTLEHSLFAAFNTD